MKKIMAIVSVFAALFSTFSVNALAANSTQLDESEMEDGILCIEEAGTYTITGKMEGTVYIAPCDGEVVLILDGADINGGDKPGIMAMSGESFRITLAEGSVNRVIGGGRDAEFQGAIFTNVETAFDGKGALYIASCGQNGICGQNATLTFEDGEFTIGAAKYGIASEGNKAGNLIFNGGNFNIEAQATVDPTATVKMNGGMVVDLKQEIAPEQGEMTQPEMQEPGQTNQQQMQEPGQMNQQQMMMQNGTTTTYESADSPSEIVTGTTTNSAAELEADLDNATYMTITDEDNDITISSSGTYVVSGTCSDGNITVKKGTTGVVLVLEDLDLTSTTGATVSVNKNAEVQIVISGQVVLTDNENPEDENSEDEDVADAFDGAALKVKDNSNVYVTGDGTLVINGNAKNGIKTGDDSSLVIDEVTVSINATNDGINSNYDVALLSGSFTIEAGDDAIHADHIVTIGNEDGTGPVINVTNCYEGIEGTVVNINGGELTIKAEDDAINAANSDGTYEEEMDYSINVRGGRIVLDCQGDGLDSNGNINLIGGKASISSANNGGEAGIDYDGEFYLSEDFELDNNSGVAGPDGEPGTMNQMNPNGMQGEMNQDFQEGMQNGMQGDMNRNAPSGMPETNKTIVNF